MQALIKPFNADNEFYFAEGCFINELSNSSDDNLSIARARVGPGVTTRWHRLSYTAERYVIVQGQGLVEVGDLPATQIGVGDVVIIPPMCRQRIQNTGVQDLVFLAISTPPFTAEVYQDLE